MPTDDRLPSSAKALHTNVSSVMQDFCPRIDMLKGNCFKKNPAMNYDLSKSAKIVLSKSTFKCQKSIYLKKKKTHIRISI